MQLQGLMQQAAQNGMMNMKVLEAVTINVANQHTTAYKTRRVDLVTAEDGRLETLPRTLTGQGALQLTHRTLDVGIEGDGYFVVTQRDGRVAYTRNGSFAKNSEGYLVTGHGDLLGTGIQVPMEYESLRIDEQGNIKVRPDKESPYKIIGRLPVVRFVNPEGLNFVGQSRWVPTEKSGPPQLIVEGSVHQTRLRQGFVERSNLNMFHQVDEILRLNAGVIANFKIIRFIDDIFRQATSLRQ